MTGNADDDNYVYNNQPDNEDDKDNGLWQWQHTTIK